MTMRLGILRLAAGRWQLIHSGDASRQPAAQSQTADLIELRALFEDTHCNTVIFALPPTWCFLSCDPQDELTETASRVEHLFPSNGQDLYMFVDKEDAADTILAIEKSKLDALVMTLKSLAKLVAIVPDSTLIAESKSFEDAIAIVTSAEWADVFVIEKNGLRKWLACGVQEPELGLALSTVLPAPFSADDLRVIDSTLALSDQDDLFKWAQQKLSAGHRFQRELTLPQLDYREGLNERYFKKLLMSFVICLGVISVALQIASYRATNDADAVVHLQNDVFRSLFPSRSVPVDPRLAVTSERKKLEREHLLGGDYRSRIPVTLQVSQCLRAIPRDLRLRVDEIRAGSAAFVIEGEARNQGTIDQLAAAIRSTQAFDLGAPRTEQRREGAVGFVISGKGRANQ